MLVIDTNVLAYLLIEGDQTAAARSLFARDADWRSEPFALIELSNVLATTMRLRGLSVAAASAIMQDARRVIERGLHVAADDQVLGLAQRHAVSAYDARFLAVAQALDQKLVTADIKLRKAAPQITQSLEEALA